MFSIVIPTYNVGELINITIQSIIGQSLQAYEIIIVDNCSTDDTLSVIKKFSNFKQNNIHIFSSPDKGIYDAQNKGISVAKYPWILFLGAGDRLRHPRVLSMLIEKIGPGSDIVYGDVFKFSGKDPSYSRTQYPPGNISKASLLQSRGICQQAIVAHKRVFQVAGFSESYQIAGDFDWILTCLEKKMRFTYINEIISDYSIDGISGNNLSRLHAELKSVVKHHYPSLVSLFYTVYLDLGYLKHKLIHLFHHE